MSLSKKLKSVKINGDTCVAMRHDLEREIQYTIEVEYEYNIEELTKDHLPLLKAIIEDMEK